MKKRLKGFVIVIPLHLPLGYPSDYIEQTAGFLARKNLVILFDFRNPTLWRETLRNIRKVVKSHARLLQCGPGEIIYFKPISIFLTRNISFLFKINRVLGIIQLRLFLFLKKRKVVLWGFHPILEELLGRFGEKFSIYDCTDYYGDEKTPDLKTQEKRLFQKVTSVAFNSSGLKKIKVKENHFIESKSIIVSCGCAVNLFNNPSVKLPKEYKNIRGQKVILAGHLDYRLDIKLLKYIIKNNKKLTFILIGPIAQEIKSKIANILSYGNVVYLGIIEKTNLATYLNHANVGIIPYKSSYYSVKYCNPMKAYEYLACGIPIISTNILALKEYSKDIIFMTNNYDNFSENISLSLKSWTAQKAKKALRIAEKNSWGNKINQIESFILK